MYQTAKSLTGYQLVQHESYALPHGYSRTYYLYKKKIPFITVEVGRGAAPLGGGEFGSIWAKNKNVVIREYRISSPYSHMEKAYKRVLIKRQNPTAKKQERERILI